MTKFLNISVDDTLGGNSASDEVVSSQKALKTYIDNHSGGGADIDNLSITQNVSNKIQTVGVIDQNNTSSALKQWSGTKTQYNAIVSKDVNTIYSVTDEPNTFQNLLETIYPVGSIYIGTMNICPLSALFGTWQLVAQDRVLQGAGTRGSVGSTLNESLPNIKGSFTADRDFVTSVSGCFKKGTRSGTGYNTGGTSSSSSTNVLNYNASESSSTYQDNAPVQQDAYLVNIWQRTA